MTARQTVQFRSVLNQTLGPSWVLLFEGYQIYQPWVSPCLSKGISPGSKHIRWLPSQRKQTCKLPSQSSWSLLTWYVRVEAAFCLVQWKDKTEYYVS